MKKILNEFLDYIQSERGYATNTRKTYEQAIKKLIGFLINEEKKLSEVNSYIFTNFVQTLRDISLGESSIKLVIEACKSFFRYLKKENILIENPLSLIGKVNVWKKIPDILMVEEIELVINSLSLENETGALYRSIIELLYGSGLRVTEICNVRACDIQNGIIRIRCGKGNKERLVPISNAFLNTLHEYWTTFRHPFPEKEDFIFTDVRNGYQLNRFQIFSKIKNIINNCKIEKKITPHSFRHSFATHLLLNGADIRIVQDMLGHSSIASTEIYLQLTLNDVKKNFKNAHPRF